MMSKEKQTVTLDDIDRLCLVARALASRPRVEVLQLIDRRNVISVNEIATVLRIPLSSAAMHVCVLEEAGLITSEKHPGIRGLVKMCTCKHQEVVFQMREKSSRVLKSEEQSLPLGSYACARGVKGPSGLASREGPIGEYNQLRSFYLPERLNAQIIWFGSGWLEYLFAVPPEPEARLEELEITFEVCANAKADGKSWRSSVGVKVNGVELGVQDCICRRPERRGRLNPEWWPDVATQYGELMQWRVTREGVWRQNERLSDISLEQVLEGRPESGISVEVGRNPDEKVSNGINLFGEGFGDYAQGIRLQTRYSY